MKSIYVASTTPYAGKTAVAMAIGLYAQRKQLRVGYFKPLSFQGYKPAELQGSVDPDAQFAARVFGIRSDLRPLLSPIRVTTSLLQQLLADPHLQQQLWDRLEQAMVALADDRDLRLIEGSGTLRDGFALGMNILTIPHRFDLGVLLLSGWRELTLTLDDVMAGHALLGDRLLGVMINGVPESELADVKTIIEPFLAQHNIALYGCLPLQPALRAISIGELVESLHANLLVGDSQTTRLIESISVGAMSVESAMPIIQATHNMAVIIGSDRTDFQGAALNSSTVTCLVLTGEFEPSAHILQRAEDQGVAVLSVPDATMTALEKIERIFGKTPMGQAEKLNRFQAIMAQHMDYDRLFNDLEGNRT